MKNTSMVDTRSAIRDVYDMIAVFTSELGKTWFPRSRSSYVLIKLNNRSETKELSKVTSSS